MVALVEEWTGHGLIGYVDVMTSQEIGTKGECIRRMISKGYDPHRVLMIGDAYPDLEAATANDTYYYPILTNKERSSWACLKSTYFDRFVEGVFEQDQEQLLHEFKTNFGAQGE